MFLKKLYSYSKVMFFGFVVFVMVFVFINYKWGLTATPIYQYGMFSGKFYIKDTQAVFKIYVNSKLLDITQYSFAERDIILMTLEKYGQHVKTNESVYAVMKKIPERLGLNIMQQELFTCNVTDKEFTEWYRKLLQGIVGYTIANLEVYEQPVAWINNRVQEISLPKKVAFIVAD
jgi:hypothetical protein